MKNLPSKHKLLYNGDSNMFFYHDGLYDKRGLPTSIHTFIRLIARNGVDTFLCNPNASFAFYPSKVVATNLDGYKRGDKNFFQVNNPMRGTDHSIETCMALYNRHLDLAEKGVNWLREVTNACQKNCIVPWLSIRMNDMHGCADLDHHYHNNSLLKNPTMRLPGRSSYPGKKNKPNWAKGMNYRHKEVRDYMFSMIKELVESYDFEGIELDFLRNPLILEPVADNAGTRLITAWIASIQELARDKSKQTGKPYPLGLRTSMNLTAMKERGLDIKGLAQEKIIDFAGFSNWFQTSWDTPFDRLHEELGDLSLYGCVEFIPNDCYAYNPKTKSSHMRPMPYQTPFLYGSAAGKHALKADGIELFNFFCGDTPKSIGDYKALRNLSSADCLRGREKNYAFNSTMIFFSFEDGVANLPCIIRRGLRHDFRLPMLCEPAGWNAELVIQVIYEKETASEFIGVGFNGSHPNYTSEPSEHFFSKGGMYAHDPSQPLTGELSLLKPEYHSSLFRFKADRIREGWNSIELYYGDFEDQSDHSDCLTVVGLEMAVKKASKEVRGKIF